MQTLMMKYFMQRVKETLATKEDLLAKLANKENLSEAALWNAVSNEGNGCIK